MKKFILSLFATSLLLMPAAGPALAQDFTGGFGANVDSIAGAAELQDTDLTTVIGNMIRIFLSILGIVFLVMVIYAGFLWMTAGGSSDNIDKAKSLLINGVIGLVIILAAYAITNFVVAAIGAAGVTTG